MVIRISLVCLAILAGVVHCQTTSNTGELFREYFCNNLKTNDCNTHPVDRKCGTDGITYRNGCELGKAYCANDTHQAHNGSCTSDSHYTRSPEEVKLGSEIAFEYQCAFLSHQDCQPASDELICGTDNYTYSNYCEYNKARCTHRHLHVANLGVCKT